jgi:lysozyme
MKIKLIDVSEHQGKIDWEKVKPYIDGAIIRCGYGMDMVSQDDSMFKYNADECTRLGIPFGVYIYSYANNEERIRSEAAHVLRLVKGYTLSYPIYLDLEEISTTNGIVARAEIFGDIIEKAGYWCGVYSSTSWWNYYLKGLERFTKWVAQWYKVCEYTGANLDIWQYSEKGKIPGINGTVDMNYCYRDFPAEILGSKAENKPVEKTVDELANEVIEGKWGNGWERRERLGDRYEEVQEAVNKKLADQKKYHVVQAGETLSLIASRYGTTYMAIANLNGLKNPNLIYAGQRLRVK